MAEPARTPPLWYEAAAFAARAHRAQLRKDHVTPYGVHPARVALIVSALFGETDDAVLAAAHLHDVIEDCDVDYDDVLERFGPHVADLVAVLTKDMRLIEPEREKAYDAQLAAGPWEGRLIKLADVYDNLCDGETVTHTLRDRAERALALAADDDRLARARRCVEELLAVLAT